MAEAYYLLVVAVERRSVLGRTTQAVRISISTTAAVSVAVVFNFIFLHNICSALLVSFLIDPRLSEYHTHMLV